MDHVSWPLVGRDNELELARGWLSDRAAGGLVIAAEPGVGKTRLAGEIADVAAASGYVVQWVRATRAAAAIPLGAFAALLPPLGGSISGAAELLARARHALAARAGDERMLLCVDDGHLLDDASAALVRGLVSAGDVFVVITVRHGERAPAGVAALSKDEHCELVELTPLSRRDLQRLAVLGAAVDPRSVGLLWEHTRGNPLFLRELLHHGIEHDLLVEDDGIWRWRGTAAVGMDLGELVAARLTGLYPATLGLLEVIAVGAPLELGLLKGAEIAALEELERRELVECLDDGRRRLVDVVHPLHGEVIRARLARTRQEAIERRLAIAIQARGARRRGDVLRVASWRLDCGGHGDADLFVRAAEQALSALDWSLAERLARAALLAGGGFGARLALARALAAAGRADDAEALLEPLQGEARTDPQRVEVAVARASNLFWGLDRTIEADDMLTDVEQAIGDRELRDDLVVFRGWLACTLGRPLDALVAAGPLLESPQVREQTRLRAALVVGTALTMRGRCEEALAVVDTWTPLAHVLRDELPLLEGQLLGTRPLALQIAGRLEEATEAAQRAYEFDLAAGSPEGTAAAAFALGCAWLARGRVRTAMRWYRESAALTRESDTSGLLPWVLAGVAQAAVDSGDAALAAASLAELEAAPVQGARSFEVAVDLTRAWCSAAAGRLSLAREQALAAAELAESLGQDGVAARALHDVARLGDPATAAQRLADIAERLDGPFAGAAAAHAAALLRRDGDALLEVAERFAAHGALLLAAEAADGAAAAYRDGGREAGARTAAQRAAALLQECEGADPPSLRGARIADAAPE